MIKSRLIRLKNKVFRDAFVRSHLSHGLAHQIRAIRCQRGWTQKDLAKKLGLSGQSAIARMEDPSYGKLSIATLLKLSSVFDVALSVRFVNYGKFLYERDDLSPTELSAVSFEDEIPMIMEDIVAAAQITTNASSDSYTKSIYFADSQSYCGIADIN